MQTVSNIYKNKDVVPSQSTYHSITNYKPVDADKMASKYQSEAS